VSDLSRSALAIRASVFAELAPRIGAHARAGGDLVALHIGDTYSRRRRERASAASSRERRPALYAYGAIPGLDALKQAFARGLVAADADPARWTRGVTCSSAPGRRTPSTARCAPSSIRATRCSCGAVLAALGRRRPCRGRGARRGTADDAPLRGPGRERCGDPRAVHHAADAGAVSHLPEQPRRLRVPGGAAPRHRRPRRARDLWVLSDEVYADYVYDGAHASIARMPGMEERTLSAYSVSKSHALAGARVGFSSRRSASCRWRGGRDRTRCSTCRSRRSAWRSRPWRRRRTGMEPRAWRTGERARDDRGAPGSGCGPGAEGRELRVRDFTPVLRGGRCARLESAIDEGVLLAPGDGCGDASRRGRACVHVVPRERLMLGVES